MTTVTRAARTALPPRTAHTAGERELLVACAVWDASPAELGRVRACAPAVEDWARWFELVQLHRLVPHAQRALHDSRAEIARDVADRLKMETFAIAARALGRARQLAGLVRLLAVAGVRAMPFKGPALSLTAYGNVGVRDSVDLDVVVDPRDLDRAREAMKAGGYSSRLAMSALQERMLQRSFGHFAYACEGEDAPSIVELHWRFAAPRYPWSLRPAEVFSRARTIGLAGVQVAIPDPTDELLLQAMHGARHHWERLEWLVAFGRLLRNDAFDGAMLVERARANGSGRALRVALRLVSDVLRGPPAALLARVPSDDTAEACVAGIAAEIEQSFETGSTPTAQPYAFNLRMMDRTGDRARYIALSVCSPTVREWEVVRLPDALVLLYYPLRLARVLVTRLRSLFTTR